MLLKDHASAKLNFLLDFSLRARNSSVNRVKINEIITIVLAFGGVRVSLPTMFHRPRFINSASCSTRKSR